MIQRREAVVSYVNTVVGRPFVWGEMDCTLFPGFCLDALLGGDESREFVGRWSNIAEAVRYSDSNNLTLENWLIRRGCQTIKKNFQQVGDFLMLETITIGDEPWLSAAVCLGDNSAVCTENGIEVFSTASLSFDYILGIR